MWLYVGFLQEVCQAKYPTEAFPDCDLKRNLSLVSGTNYQSEGREGDEEDGVVECQKEFSVVDVKVQILAIQ